MVAPQGSVTEIVAVAKENADTEGPIFETASVKYIQTDVVATCIPPIAAIARDTTPDDDDHDNLLSEKARCKRKVYPLRNSLVATLLPLLGALFGLLPSNNLALAQLDVTDVDQYPCDVPRTDIQRTIMLYFDDKDMNATTNASFVDILEETFMDTYNGQSFVACDVPHFRTIRSATSTNASTGTNMGYTSYIMLTVFAECGNCNDSLPLFLEPPAPENITAIFNSTATYNSTITDNSLVLNSNTDGVATSKVATAVPNIKQVNAITGGEASCVCKIGAETITDPLTKENFLRQLNRNLGIHTNTNTKVLDVVELQTLPCSNSIQSFNSFVYVDFNLLPFKDNRKLLARELAALENAFVEAYTNLTFGSCDRYFRSVTNVALDLYLEELEESSDETTNMGVATFTVQAQCRNCPVSGTGSFPLFDGNTFAGFSPGSTELFRNVRNSIARSPTFNPSFNRKLQADMCICPLAPAHAGGGLLPLPSMSQDDFVVLYNTKLIKLQEADVLEVVESVNDIGEGQNVECSSELSKFETVVYSDMRVNLTSLTRQEAQSLENAFKESYNQLAYQTCDGHFRQVDEVELRIAPTDVDDSNSNGRRLQDILQAPSQDSGNNTATNITTENYTTNTNTTNTTNTTVNNSSGGGGTVEERKIIVPTLFAVQGNCRNCPVLESGAFNLFDDVFRRRRALTAINVGSREKLFSNWVRKLQLNRAVCVCPVGEEPTVGQGPVSKDFEIQLNAELLELEEEGKVASVEAAAGNIVEGQPVLCNGEIRPFKSFVYADLGVDANTLTNSTKDTLEKVFEDTYNSLSFEACDEFFRVVSEVAVVASQKIDGGGRSLQARNQTMDSNMTLNSPAGIIFAVTGRCRNCPISDSGGFALFDDSFRRMLKSDVQASLPGYEPQNAGGPRRMLYDTNPERRLQQALDVCLCPIGKEPGEERNSTSRLFLQKFNSKVVEAQEEAQNELDEEIGIDEGGDEGNEIDLIQVLPALVLEEIEVTDDRIPLIARGYSGATNMSTPTLPPSPTPTQVPTVKPTQTLSPAVKPTSLPTSRPTLQPNPSPTRQPTPNPTRQPTPSPTRQPTPSPTRQPTPSPTRQPTPGPTREPTSSPTPNPTPEPTPDPTLPPTTSPTTKQPTARPSSAPSSYPSSNPSLGCAEPLQEWGGTYSLRFAGDLSTLSDTYLTNTFVSASQIIDGATGCTPSMNGVAVKDRRQERGRRNLQVDDVTLSAEVDFDLLAVVVSEGDLWSDTYAKSLTSNMNAKFLRDDNAVTVLGPLPRTANPSQAPSFGPSSSVSPSVSLLPTTATSTPSNVPSKSVLPSSLPSLAPSVSQRPSSFPSLSPSASQAPSIIPSVQPSAGPSSPPSLSPSTSQRPSIIPSVNPSACPSRLPSLGPSASQLPSSLPSKIPSQMPSDSPSVHPSLTPSAVPSMSVQPSKVPSLSPSASQNPSSIPSVVPSNLPSVSPSESQTPSAMPSESGVPSGFPSILPSSGPSSVPSESGMPSSSPSSVPSFEPSSTPSLLPSQQPSICPSAEPSSIPSLRPSKDPSSTPSFCPSEEPSISPSTLPSLKPSLSPSKEPSSTPSLIPSKEPSMQPSLLPSEIPSVSPTAPPPITFAGGVTSSFASSDLNYGTEVGAHCYYVDRYMEDTIYDDGCKRVYLTYTYYNGGFEPSGNPTGCAKEQYYFVETIARSGCTDQVAQPDRCNLRVVGGFGSSIGTAYCNSCTRSGDQAVLVDCSNLDVFIPGSQNVEIFFDSNPVDFYVLEDVGENGVTYCDYPYWVSLDCPP